MRAKEPSVPYSTTLPKSLKEALDALCEEHGLLRTHVVEEALREKIEDLLDAYELSDAVKEGGSFRSWKEIRTALRGTPGT